MLRFQQFIEQKLGKSRLNFNLLNTTLGSIVSFPTLNNKKFLRGASIYIAGIPINNVAGSVVEGDKEQWSKEK